ncbi:MAG: B12-binding domain-containing protein [Ilumatobacteraceae bacterium]
MTAPDLTLHEAAALLGVHYMTAYRYVRLGLLPAVKSGGSWRVTAADLAQFQQAARAGAVAEPVGGGRRRAPWADRLEARLVAGDSAGAWGVVEAAMAAGSELDDIYLDVIAPAMRSIGTRWASGELDVAEEHRATGIAFRLLGRLSPRFARRGRSRGAVVLGTPAGERHSLPVALLADLVRGGGWEVTDLGADLPADSFARVVATTEGLVAVGVSVTSQASVVAAGELLPALRAAAPAGVLLVVGGAAIVDEAQALAVGADRWAASAREFLDLLATAGGHRDRSA